jgi:hypothetical protein
MLGMMIMMVRLTMVITTTRTSAQARARKMGPWASPMTACRPVLKRH